MKRLSFLWRRHPVIFSGFLLAMVLAVFFVARSIMVTIYWADPAHRDLALAPWMTVGYVAHSWQLPREVMSGALDLPSRGEKSKTMGQIAVERDMTLDQLSALIESAAEAHRAKIEAAGE